MGEMDVEGLIVEWDDNKAAINVKKHKIHFEDAALVFYDEARYEEFDELHSDYEDRYKTVGRVRGVLAVIYTERDETEYGRRIRLISARPATTKEEEKYYGQFGSF